LSLHQRGAQDAQEQLLQFAVVEVKRGALPQW
jgi:hypothetical protein